MGEYLTKEVFEVWAHGFDRRLDERLSESERTRDIVDAHSEQLAVLTDRSDREDKKSMGVSGVISLVVSGAISGLQWYFGGSKP